MKFSRASILNCIVFYILQYNTNIGKFTNISYVINIIKQLANISK